MAECRTSLYETQTLRLPMTNSNSKNPVVTALFVALTLLFLFWIARDGYRFGAWLKNWL